MFSISSSNCRWVLLLVPYRSVSLPRLIPVVSWGQGFPYLEGEVLKEVRGTIGLVGLCPRTGIDPHADGRRLGIRRVLGGNLHQLASARYGRSYPGGQLLTVRPFFKVVVWVLIGPETGVASPLREGTERPEAVRPRRPCARFFRTSLRDAMGEGGGMGRCVV